jgi:hypothetical protein
MKRQKDKRDGKAIESTECRYGTEDPVAQGEWLNEVHH